MTAVWTAAPGGAERDGWTEQVTEAAFRISQTSGRTYSCSEATGSRSLKRLVSASGPPPPPSPTPGFRRRSVLELQPDGRKSIEFEHIFYQLII